MENCERCGCSIKRPRTFIANGYGKPAEEQEFFLLCPSCFSLCMQSSMILREKIGNVAMMLADMSNILDDIEAFEIAEAIKDYIKAKIQ